MVHAQGEGEFWLVDLGSANGTYVNGRRVSPSCRLSDQDRIEIGNHACVFRQPKAQPSSDTDRSTEKTIQDIKIATCWMLVADIERHTQIVKRLPAEEVSRITGEWLSECKQIIDDNNGAINKFLGDGFFAYWAAKDKNLGPSVAKAVEGLKMLQDRETPRFRVVVHYGSVHIGGASLGEESILGREVNFIFRMEKLAAELALPRLISEAANTGVAQILHTKDAGRHIVRSFEPEGDFAFFTL